MPNMTITITGAMFTPMWETLQQVVRESTGRDGCLTRIVARRDNQYDYRGMGTYDERRKE